MARGGRTWRVALAVALGAVVVLEVVTLVGDVSGGSEVTGAPGAGGARAVLPASSDGPTPTTKTPPMPPSMPPLGSWVESEVGADGTVSVVQWVRSPQPVDRIRLAVGDAEGASAPLSDGAQEGVGARDVLVHDMTGALLGGTDTVSSQPRDVGLRPASLGFVLSYTLTGPTLATTAPTVPGRSLARTLGLDVSFAAEAGPTVRVVRARDPVLNAACVAVVPDAAGSAPSPGTGTAPGEVQPRPCGAPTADGGWRVDLRGERRHTRLLAQLGPA